MTDEQLEKQISEEFEKAWKEAGYHEPKYCDSHSVKSFREGFKAAALPLMKKIEEFKETPVWLVFENAKWIEKENEELEEHKIILNNRIDVLQKENEELRKDFLHFLDKSQYVMSENIEPEGCCDGRDCGCMGKPINSEYYVQELKKEYLAKWSRSKEGEK